MMEEVQQMKCRTGVQKTCFSNAVNFLNEGKKCFSRVLYKDLLPISEKDTICNLSTLGLAKTFKKYISTMKSNKYNNEDLWCNG